MELQFSRLEEEVRTDSALERPMAYIRHDTPRQPPDYGDLMEWPPVGRYCGPSGFRQVIGNSDSFQRFHDFSEEFR